MRVLILGAAGMIGRKLTARLLADGLVGDRAVERLALADVVNFTVVLCPPETVMGCSS